MLTIHIQCTVDLRTLIKILIFSNSVKFTKFTIHFL